MFIRGGTVNELPRAADDGGAGGETFSGEYVRALRAEAAGYRKQLREAEATLETSNKDLTKANSDLTALRTERAAAISELGAAKTALDAAVKERETALGAAKTETAAAVEAAKAELTASSNGRIIEAELKARAAQAGLIDLDGLKLLDTSKVVLDEKGEVKVPDGFFDEARKAKPYLFGTNGTSTSSQSTPPMPGENTPKLAKDMTPEERAAGLRALNVRV